MVLKYWVLVYFIGLGDIGTDQGLVWAVSCLECLYVLLLTAWLLTVT
jgi:hypothetical protein